MTTRILVLAALLLLPAPSRADSPPNAATAWASIVQQAIHHAGAPRSAGTAEVLHTMAMLAIYDAAVAIEGGYTPYAANIPASAGADIRAAIATAAYRTVRPRVALAEQTFLDQQYAHYLAGVADGQAKAEGIRIGGAAAEAILAVRANDGFGNVVLYRCTAVPPPPGEFEPDAGCPTQPGAPQPADAKMAQIRPFTFTDPSRFMPGGPDPLTSSAYTEDFLETRDYGRADSLLRSPEQTDVAFFWAEHPYVHWNRNLIRLAVARGLSTLETARFFAMVHTAAADATIAGFAAKYYYVFWRPRTAIPRADTDGNPDTDADPTWTPLISVNHPEYPSGHAFWSTAVVDAVAAFFGTDKVTWTMVTSKVAVPRVVQTERTYYRLNALMREIIDARVWAGLHWRHSMMNGAQVGRRVAAHVLRNYFGPRM